MQWAELGEQWIPRDTDYFIRKEIIAENARKQKDWELIKNRREDKMKADMEKIRKQEENDSHKEATATSAITPSKAKIWFEMVEEEKADWVSVDSSKEATQSSGMVVPSTSHALDLSPTLDLERIYWDEDNEIYVHTYFRKCKK